MSCFKRTKYCYDVGFEPLSVYWPFEADDVMKVMKDDKGEMHANMTR